MKCIRFDLSQEPLLVRKASKLEVPIRGDTINPYLVEISLRICERGLRDREMRIAFDYTCERVLVFRLKGEARTREYERDCILAGRTGRMGSVTGSVWIPTGTTDCNEVHCVPGKAQLRQVHFYRRTRSWFRLRFLRHCLRIILS